MHQTPPAASKPKLRCIERRLPHRNPNLDASNAARRIETRTSMHQTPPAASKPEPRCIKRRLLHRNLNFDASNAALPHRNPNFDASNVACCIETRKSMHHAVSAVWHPLVHTEQAITIHILRFCRIG
jgi:hypothetical protein